MHHKKAEAVAINLVNGIMAAIVGSNIDPTESKEAQESMTKMLSESVACFKEAIVIATERQTIIKPQNNVDIYKK